MESYVNCCGYTVSRSLYDFLVENDFSVRVACVVCRHFATVDETIFYLKEVAQGRLFLRNLGKRSTAEIAEKIQKYM